MTIPLSYIPQPQPEPHLADEYFARRREIAAAAKRAGYVGRAVPLDPHS